MIKDSSNKLKSNAKIRNNIMDVLNNNQEIKRLLYYKSTSPLNLQACDEDKNVVEQPDLEIDFIMDIKRIHSIFSKKILDVIDTHIFVRRLNGDLSDYVHGKNTIVVDFIVPINLSLLNEGQDRESLLGSILCDMVDRTDALKTWGNTIVTHYTESMLENSSKVEFNVLSLFIEYDTCNMRF